MQRIALALTLSLGLGIASASACEVSDLIGSDTCPIKVAMENYDANKNEAVSSDELVKAAGDEALAGTPAQKGMSNDVAKIIVRMVDADKDKEISASELETYVAKLQ